jgi:hypothetical protein
MYGPPGTFKTSVANGGTKHGMNTINLETEKALTSQMLAGAETFGVLKTYEDLLDAIEYVGKNSAEKGWKIVNIDTLDRLHPLVVDYVCRNNVDKNGKQWKSLEDGAYGRGKVAYVDQMRLFMDAVLWLRDECGLSVFLVSHHKEIKRNPPDTEPYSQWSLALSEDAARIIYGDCDAMLFATTPLVIKGNQQGFGAKGKAVARDKPVLRTTMSGAHLAKNRFNMPSEIPMSWEAIAEHIPAWAPFVKKTEAAE